MANRTINGRPMWSTLKPLPSIQSLNAQLMTLEYVFYYTKLIREFTLKS